LSRRAPVVCRPFAGLGSFTEGLPSNNEDSFSLMDEVRNDCIWRGVCNSRSYNCCYIFLLWPVCLFVFSRLPCLLQSVSFMTTRKVQTCHLSRTHLDCVEAKRIELSAVSASAKTEESFLARCMTDRPTACHDSFVGCWRQRLHAKFSSFCLVQFIVGPFLDLDLFRFQAATNRPPSLSTL
jgi:hypothetical protein